MLAPGQKEQCLAPADRPSAAPAAAAAAAEDAEEAAAEGVELTEADIAKNIAKLLPAMLVGADQKCLIADQTQWPWREEFRAACAEGGLEVSEMPLPGPEDVKLLSITRAAEIA